MPSRRIVQCRSESAGLIYCKTISEAMRLARADTSIWKISVNIAGERIRLVRKGNNATGDIWIYEPILEERNENGEIQSKS